MILGLAEALQREQGPRDTIEIPIGSKGTSEALARAAAFQVE